MATRRRLWGVQKSHLGLALAAFVVTLAIPTGVLVYHAYAQLKSEAFYGQRVLAEEFAQRIDARVRALIEAEEARSAADYRFLIAQGDATTNFVQRSPLAAFPVDSTIPGLLAYFQIDARGVFSTPLLPVDADAQTYGVTVDEVVQRRALEAQARELLLRGDLGTARVLDVARETAPKAAAPEAAPTATAPAFAQKVAAPEFAQKVAAPTSAAAVPAAPPAPAESVEVKLQSAGRAHSVLDGPEQSVFDKLDQVAASAPSAANEAPPRGADFESDASLGTRGGRLDAQPASMLAKSSGDARASRKERAAVPEIARQRAAGSVVQFDAPVRVFDGELDPLVLRRLDADHWVLFRKVALDGERLIQGAILAQHGFIEGLIDAPYRDTALSRATGLRVAYRGDVVADVGASGTAEYARDANGELLYRAALSAPLDDVELVFSIAQLPVGPGGRIVGWASFVLAMVMSLGAVAIYRLGAAQIDLNRRQQDFVSAVSHELKTPLTSIRMYGEILKAGWADEAKKQTYYDFIFHESERLSRLIANVLQLSRLTRGADPPELKTLRAGELIDLVRSRISAQVEQAGFSLRVDNAPGADDASVAVSSDHFVQIVINLVDNALKFSAGAQRKEIELGCARAGKSVEFYVRDFGAGVPRQQMKRIFELFYRGESELTRETVGTGIGLALVERLTNAMGGSVAVRNRDPGAEFVVAFPEVV